MSKSTIKAHISEPVAAFRRRNTRGKAGILAAGLGASALLGTGVAMAAEAGSQSDVFASSTASEIAQSTRAQADQQSKAAEEKKAAEAKKEAEKREHEKKKAARKEARDALDGRAGWTSPIHADYTLTATFGNSGDRWSHGHSGQDFAVPVGTAVHAANSGTVVKAGGNGAGDGSAYGNAVVVKHDNGRYTQYAHLSQVNVSAGEHVKSGEIIAKSGNTGNSSGPHLHFEVRTTPNYGSALEPVEILGKHGVKL